MGQFSVAVDTMSLDKAIGIGIAGNEASKVLTSSDEVSAGRSFVATGAGATIGAITAGTVTVGAAAAGFAISAPIVVPLAVAGGICACIASWFD